MHRDATGPSRLRAPEHGIVSSQRPRGKLGRRWMALVEERGGEYADRIARGRSWARGGRVRDLWFAPGIANAEVMGAEGPHQVSIRVTDFDQPGWDLALGVLGRDLRHIAALMEGELPDSLLDAFAEEGLSMLPAANELDVRCTCDDFATPCAHAAAVHHVLADALDGEPFLLLTLRGRPREQVLAGLRRLWGDPGPIRELGRSSDDEPGDGDWLRSPEPLPPMAFSFTKVGAVPGLRELGSPPGEGDLERALAPLYDAGAEAALELALREVTEPTERRPRMRIQVRPQENEMPITEDASAPRKNAPQDVHGAQDGATLAERLVDALAHMENARSKELADKLEVSLAEVRQELLELEKMGIVYRTGQTRGTRWWLG